MGRSVGCDLPQHVAEKFSKKNTFLYIFLIYLQQVRAKGKEADFLFSCLFLLVGRIITHNQRDDSLEGSLDQKEIHFNFSPAHNLYRQRL
jgi:hypothetical protein